MAVLKRLYDKYQAGEILDKNELINVESMGKSMSFRIHTLVGRLRKNLADAGSEKIIIENEYGKGYRMSVMKLQNIFPLSTVYTGEFHLH